MRFRITGQGWQLGDALVPAETIVDLAKSDRWSKLAKGKTIPINATPLDEEASGTTRSVSRSETSVRRRLELIAKGDGFRLN